MIERLKVGASCTLLLAHTGWIGHMYSVPQQELTQSGNHMEHDAENLCLENAN